MKSLFKYLIFGYNKAHRAAIKIYNMFSSRKKCYICNRTFKYFEKYKSGSKSIPEFRKKLEIVGSDVDNFKCLYCSCHDRERHLFMFFDKLKLWDLMHKAHILHFAPESSLQKKIAEQSPHKYVLGDIFPQKKGVEKIDATQIPYGDNIFDLIIANHVLEHIPEYKKAIGEIYRVLRLGGIAILQTPYSKLLKCNFDDENINNDELRLFFHGERDHFRTFGFNQFKDELRCAGFKLHIIDHSEYFTQYDAIYYGVNEEESLIMVEKSEFDE